MHPSQVFSSVRWGLLPLALWALACGGPAGPAALGPGPTFPPYIGEATRLFDDRIDPNAVGLADVAIDPRTDATLRLRSQRAEAVGRMRISTVSVDLTDDKPTYRLNLAFVEAPLARRGFTDNHIEIVVRADSPSFGIVKWLDNGLIGRTFVCFFRRFAAIDEGQIRFHLSADNPELVAAVREANALSEVSAK